MIIRLVDLICVIKKSDGVDQKSMIYLCCLKLTDESICSKKLIFQPITHVPCQNI